LPFSKQNEADGKDGRGYGGNGAALKTASPALTLDRSERGCRQRQKETRPIDPAYRVPHI